MVSVDQSKRNRKILRPFLHDEDRRKNLSPHRPQRPTDPGKPFTVHGGFDRFFFRFHFD